MKAKSARSKSKPVLNVGSFLLYRAPRTGVGGWKPNWMVKLRFPGKADRNRTSDFQICALCQAVPRGESVTKARPSCGCREGALAMAQAWLDDERAALMQQRRSQWDQVLEERDVLRWSDVQPVWMANAPVASRAATWNRLRLLVEQSTGLPMDGQRVDALTWPVFLDWAQMRQEFARRWPEGAPVEVKDPWALLRADLRGGKLPALVTNRVMEVNTTIKGYLRSARNVVGAKARSVHLRSLPLPAMTDFLEGRLDLPSPMGHVEIPPEVYARMYAAAEVLRGEDEQLWLVNQLLWRFGLRPIEVWLARSNWVEMDGDVPVLVLKNRADEYIYESGYKKGQGSELKARHRAIVRRYRIPGDVWEVVRRVMVPGGSLLGVPTSAAAQALVEKEHSAWMRLWMPDTTHSNYLLRHFLAAYTTARWGPLAASLFMGHSTSEVRATVTQSRYAGGGGTKLLPAIEWADLAPDAKYVRRMRGEFEDEELFKDG